MKNSYIVIYDKISFNDSSKTKIEEFEFFKLALQRLTELKKKSKEFPVYFTNIKGVFQKVAE